MTELETERDKLKAELASAWTNFQDADGKVHELTKELAATEDQVYAERYKVVEANRKVTELEGDVKAYQDLERITDNVMAEHLAAAKVEALEPMKIVVRNIENGSVATGWICEYLKKQIAALERGKGE